jgi:hypothetical protein
MLSCEGIGSHGEGGGGTSMGMRVWQNIQAEGLIRGITGDVARKLRELPFRPGLPCLLPSTHSTFRVMRATYRSHS